RHRPHDRLGRRCRRRASPRGDSRRRADGRQRGAGHRARAPRRGRRLVRRRARARNQGGRAAAGLRRCGAAGRRAGRVDAVPRGISMTTIASDLDILPAFGRRDPDARGYFGEFGGRFVPETLVAPIEELTDAYLAARRDPAFVAELGTLLRHYVGRPTPLYEAARLSEAAGTRVLLKREDLAHT